MMQKELPVDLGELLHESDGYGRNWPIQKMKPEYGMWGRGKLRKAFSEIRIADQEIRKDLEELVNIFERNQLGCLDQGRACGQVEEFARGAEIATSVRNDRASRRAGIDIAEIRRSAESDLQTRRSHDGLPLGIINGR